MGCVIAPLTFNMFYTAFPVGKEDSAYAAPYATVYRAMAILGTQGFGALPSHCLQLFVAWFFIAIAMALARSIPFYCTGSMTVLPGMKLLGLALL